MQLAGAECGVTEMVIQLVAYIVSISAASYVIYSAANQWDDCPSHEELPAATMAMGVAIAVTSAVKMLSLVRITAGIRSILECVVRRHTTSYTGAMPLAALLVVALDAASVGSMVYVYSITAQDMSSDYAADDCANLLYRPASIVATGGFAAYVVLGLLTTCSLCMRTEPRRSRGSDVAQVDNML